MKTSPNLRNFICLLIYWSITSFNYFLLNLFMSQLPGGHFYKDAVTSSFSESIGCMLAGFIAMKNNRLCLVLSNLVPAIGASGLIYCYYMSNKYAKSETSLMFSSLL